ncbi:MAG: T9SS type A sorting domain-containing protein [Flavobacteriales bacterium]|nr:T9SS type A sorting domain-containing protein [Flavobacteriales bacterium]
MKKITFLIVLLYSSFLTFGQVGVSTSPVIPTASDDIVLKFDALGTPLESADGIYAHIGLTVNGNRWKGVIAGWAVNVPKNTFTNIGGTQYELNLGNLHDYFGFDRSTDVISEICLVIRNATGSAKSENDDIFIKIHEDGLNAQITSPSNSQVFEQGTSTTIVADASAAAKLEIYINNDLVASEESVTTLSKEVTFSSQGNVTIKVVATTDTATKEHEINIYVPQVTIQETRPSNLKHGITRHENGDVSFMLFATNKTGVMIVGDFNDWTFSSDYQMKKDGDYYWLTIPAGKLDPNAEYAYQYVVDFNKRFADPYCEKVLDPDQDKWLNNSQYPNLKPYPHDKTSGLASSFIINEPAYDWKDGNFVRPNKTNAVIYELHLRDFTSEGTLNAAFNRLDYLKGLGVTTIELMPINEFEGNNSWGYNPSFYFALDKAYGTKNDLKRFVNGCHQRGMSVILDMVFNHTFGQSPLLQMYEFSYDDGGKTVNNPYYADQHNFKEPGMRYGLKIDHESEHTQRWIKDAMSYWINEYHVDGYRLDLTKGFTNTQYPVGDWGSARDQTRINRLLDYSNYVHTNHGQDIIFSCEHLADNSEEKELADKGLMFWGNMNHKYGQAAMGYSSDSDLSSAYHDNRGWNNKHLISYMESHDEERNMYRLLNWGQIKGDYNTKEEATALKRLELATCFFLTIPGPKLIWQFGELGYDYGINYCMNTDTYGDCRVDRKPIKWEYFDNTNRRNLYGVYNKLNTLKQAFPNTFNSSTVRMSLDGLTKRIRLFDDNDRSASGLHVVVIGNFDTVAKDVEPMFAYTGTWYEFFSGEERQVTEIETGTIRLQPGEYRLYSTQKFLSNNKFEFEGISENQIKLFPNPANDQISFSQTISSAIIVDISGKIVASYDNVNDNTITIEQLNSGFYFVQTEDQNGKTSILRFVKE